MKLDVPGRVTFLLLLFGATGTDARWGFERRKPYGPRDGMDGGRDAIGGVSPNGRALGKMALHGRMVVGPRACCLLLSVTACGFEDYG